LNNNHWNFNNKKIRSIYLFIIRFTHVIPPYNGYGIEEDSLGNVFSLNAKPPKKDVKKMFSCDQYILRFEARLLSESREDNDRKFIISFFCGNDTIMVYIINSFRLHRLPIKIAEYGLENI
tara:strand:- start:592 stop:954 length:363 start_codon:yes stop_codon:yes gene_type:complete